MFLWIRKRLLNKTVGLWSWESSTVKKCVTTYLPSVGATKTDGAKAKYRYFGYMPRGMSW